MVSSPFAIGLDDILKTGDYNGQKYVGRAVRHRFDRGDRSCRCPVLSPSLLGAAHRERRYCISVCCSLFEIYQKAVRHAPPSEPQHRPYHPLPFKNCDGRSTPGIQSIGLVFR